MPPRHSRARAGTLHGGRSLDAHVDFSLGPIGPEDGEPTWETDDDEYRAVKAYVERLIGAAVPGRFLTARAGSIVGPDDRVGRLGLPSRPLARTVADTQAWLQGVAELPPRRTACPDRACRPSSRPRSWPGAETARSPARQSPDEAPCPRPGAAPSRGSPRACER